MASAFLCYASILLFFPFFLIYAKDNQYFCCCRCCHFISNITYFLSFDMCYTYNFQYINMAKVFFEAKHPSITTAAAAVPCAIWPWHRVCSVFRDLSIFQHIVKRNGKYGLLVYLIFLALGMFLCLLLSLENPTRRL